MKYATLSRDINGAIEKRDYWDENSRSYSLVNIAFILSIIINFHKIQLKDVMFGFIGDPYDRPSPGVTFSYRKKEPGNEKIDVHIWYNEGRGEINHTPAKIRETPWQKWSDMEGLIKIFMYDFHRNLGYEKCPVCRL